MFLLIGTISHTYVCRYCSGVEAEEAGKRIKESELLETITAIVSNQIILCVYTESMFERTGALDSNLQRQQSLEAEIERHKKEISRIDTRMKTLYMDKCDGLFDEMEYVRMRQSYEQNRETFTIRLAELSAEKERLSAMAIQNNPYIKAFRPFYGAEALTREMLLALVKRIEVVSDKQIEILFQYREEYEALKAAVQESKTILTCESKVMAG